MPYLGVKLLPNYQKHDAASLYQTPIYTKLRAIITYCVRFRKTVILVTVAALVMSAAVMAILVDKQFFPSSDRPEVLVSVYLPQGSSIKTTDATVQKLESALSELPEVKSLSSYIGAGAPRFFISANPEQPDPSFAKIIAIGDDAAGRDRIMAALKQRIANGEFPEARIRVTSLLFGPPVVWPVSFRVVGPDVDEGVPDADNSKRPLNPEFPLNFPRYQGASILLARENFGCGSSREHAPWALVDYGFRAVIAPSFADIFRSNCFKNGLLPIELDEAVVEQLFRAMYEQDGFRLKIDLSEQRIEGFGSESLRFDVDEFRKDCLLKGLDDIGITLQRESAIRQFEETHRHQFPWVFDVVEI